MSPWQDSAFHPVTINHLCAHISTKRILFIGPESTFHLHSLWLHLENRTHICKGPEFCTFHHICLPSDIQIDQQSDRFQKLPTEKVLAATHSSILRYVQSTSLYPSKDVNDPMFTIPRVDSTGVRRKEMYWFGPARKADVLVINRGPLPAPAWSYADDGWLFVDELYRNSSTMYLPRIRGSHSPAAQRIFNAAIHATFTSFLPSLRHTLREISQDPLLKKQIIIWHGSWFMQPVCSHSRRLRIRNLEDLLASGGDDPWGLYYNAQVYIHNHILPSVLREYRIPFLSINLDRSPALPPSLDFRKNCDGLRPPPNSPEAISLTEALVGGLARILPQSKEKRSRTRSDLHKGREK